jgi:hypothetical protein
LGKLIEKATAQKIRNTAEQYNLLPDKQIGARVQRSTTTVLNLLTSVIKSAWASKGQVATLLSLDIAGAFDTIVYLRLVAVIQKLGFPQWVSKWVTSFLSDRTIYFSIIGEISEEFSLQAGVPQGSPLSLILFLLYNIELIQICSLPKQGLYIGGFVDNMHLIAISLSTETNCNKLTDMHRRILRYTQYYSIHFAPAKYKLVHFTRAQNRFNLAATIQLG